MTEDEFVTILKEHYDHNDRVSKLSKEKQNELYADEGIRRTAKVLLRNFNHEKLKEQFTAWKKGPAKDI